MSDYLPVIGITMGDATGIGPEVIVKSLAHDSVRAQCRPLVIGDARRLELAGRLVGSPLKVHAIQAPEEARFQSGTIDCIDLGLIPEDLPFGKLSAVAGDAAFRYIERAVALTRDEKIDAICTAPLNKEALHAGGHKFPGHTEMLATLQRCVATTRLGRCAGVSRRALRLVCRRSTQQLTLGNARCGRGR